MHVLQYLAVEVEDQLEDPEQEAMQLVEDFLNSEMGGNEYATNSWYDWFIIGGGRFVSGDPYESSPNHIVSIDKSGKDVFIQTINDCLTSRMREFADYRASFDKSEVDLNAKLDSYTGVMDYSFELYPLKKMIDMMNGEWDYNSYYFDLETWSTNPKYILDEIEKDNKEIYLVPIDFHF
jgi:hypothetical protein